MKFINIRGFTLTELLVAVTIVAIMSAIGFVSFSTIQKNARDSKRKEDINNFALAVELYKQVKGAYPATSACTAAASFTGALVPATPPTFINKIPTDPACQGAVTNSAGCPCGTSGNDYYYGLDATTGRVYFFAATEILNDTTSTCGQINPTNPDAAHYKYCYAP